MIQAGQKIPLNVRLNVLQGDDEKQVAINELLTRPTVFSVYMRNNTGGCDKQNDSLVKHAAALAKAGYNLVAVSRDTIASHRKYAAKKGIAYVLASDPEDAFARATDSLVEKSMYGKKFTGPARAAYVVDRDGTVLAVVPKVDTADHGAQLKAVLAGLK
ncbi:MAG TPA: redoxin domain-containing protein [Opitutaceae bacterium]|nr:redoxin domain-containing protein [Opitutaceae bacterium]HRJ48382.1 redoxin domain-containing protein [Opitutaceae bacterium]